MSIKVFQNYFTSKINDFDTFTKIAYNVGDLGKLIVAKGFEKLSNESPNLVTLVEGAKSF